MKMSLYCRGVNLAAKIFRGTEDDTGLIDYRLSNLLEAYDYTLPKDDTLAEIQVASTCIAWQKSNPDKVMFHNAWEPTK
jgi:hypothetical protein